MKEYTREQMESIENQLNVLIEKHDSYDIRELCQKEEYALYCFTQKALEAMSKIQHIKGML